MKIFQEFVNSIALPIFLGVIIAVITSCFTIDESDRRHFNHILKKVSDEIEKNKKRLDKDFPEEFQKAKEKWIVFEKTWIQDKSISDGYGGYLYNFLLFDSYNIFISEGMIRYTDDNQDTFNYGLKELYHHLKQFSAKTQRIKETINSIISLKIKNDQDGKGIEKPTNSFHEMIKLQFQEIQNEYDEIQKIMNKRENDSKKIYAKSEKTFWDCHLKNFKKIFQ